MSQTKLKLDLTRKFGGLAKAFDFLMDMDVWGRSRKYEVVDGELTVSDKGYTYYELRDAIRELLEKEVRMYQAPDRIQYRSADEYPEVYSENVRLDGITTFSKSPKLLLKYRHRGEVNYVTGYMINYHDERPNVYHLDGHNGDWHNTVEGWIYC
ncbi:hypothetical protein BJD49_gp052 [Acinetobacter phage vB_AbaM_phiAbaA1]|uniref:hypothetical protein n=1 Tax=Acinetobacter phage vB_AbaM_phiAbaA1 TaxID=1605379 RepID=UPI00078E5CD9|nr:hypothetical protein BJD49_gp052 [Acinetobacter phage vB_AbaM_phiAbaA1]AJK27238.1 hypothetical protein phiAbaA1_135 [Acinetobacter phage vB_AbaM_phiAbaA1]